MQVQQLANVAVCFAVASLWKVYAVQFPWMIIEQKSILHAGDQKEGLLQLSSDGSVHFEAIWHVCHRAGLRWPRWSEGGHPLCDRVQPTQPQACNHALPHVCTQDQVTIRQLHSGTNRAD